MLDLLVLKMPNKGDERRRAQTQTIQSEVIPKYEQSGQEVA